MSSSPTALQGDFYCWEILKKLIVQNSENRKKQHIKVQLALEVYIKARWIIEQRRNYLN